MTSGILVIDKPPGLTSHDVVVAARRALGERRIGHCGTLDPMATGVLALAIGQATRLVQFLSGEAKHYDAIVGFGRATTTYDISGDLVSESERRPSRAELDEALTRFRGPLMQVPPAFSAKRVGGVRAYTLARQSAAKAAGLPPVPVTCHELRVTFFDGERAGLTMVVSAGFYVRSLAHDLGQALGTVAVLESLRRTRSGSFGLEGAVPFDVMVRAGREALAARLVPIDQLLPDVPVLPLPPEAVTRVRHGMDLPLPNDWPTAPALVRLVADEGRLVALAVPADRPGFLHPAVVLG